MNNNMTGTNTLNAIYENMGCKGEVVFNGNLRPLSEDTFYLNRVHETTGGKSRVEMAKQLAHDSVYGYAPSTREIWEGLIPRTEAKDVKDYFTVAKEVKRKCPSNLEVVPYVADKHAHLPDYAREMIEMIEEAEYEALEKKNDKPFTWLSYTSEDKILLIKVINNPDNTSSISETVTLNRLTGDVINE